MSTDLVTTGKIVKALKSTCVVSVTVGTSTKQLSFSKTKFYSYGLKCDGDMTNLLDEGMELELCIRALPDAPPQVLIAWLGDRPEVVDDEETFKPVYDQRGILCGVWLSDFIVESHCGKVIVNKAIVFRDGEQFAALTTEDEMWFDAVPLENIHATGASYNATCAWVGHKPRLVDRFQLKEKENLEVDSEVVTGTVVVVPNDVVAVAEVILNDVAVETTPLKVLVFRSSFKEGCDRIQDVVEVGNTLRMGLSQDYVFPGKKLCFAQVALKGVGDLPTELVNGGRNGAVDSDVPTDEAVKEALYGEKQLRFAQMPLKGVADLPTELVFGGSYGAWDSDVPTDEAVKASVKEALYGEKQLRFAQVPLKGVADLPTELVFGGSYGAWDSDVPTDEAVKASVKEALYGEKQLRFAQVPLKGVADLPTELVNGEKNGAADSIVSTDETVSVKASVKEKALYGSPALKGVISRMSGSGYLITYGESKVFLDEENFYEGGKRASYSDLKSYAKPGKNTIKFEAVAMNRKGEKYAEFTHEATCAWLGNKPTLRAVAAQLPPPNYKILKEKPQIFYGIVSKICFPWIALVRIPGLTTTVSVHANEIITKDRHTASSRWISSFVNLGDCVQFRVERRPECSNFLCAYHVKLVKHSKELYDDVNSGRVSRKPPENAVKAV